MICYKVREFPIGRPHLSLISAEIITETFTTLPTSTVMLTSSRSQKGKPTAGISVSLIELGCIFLARVRQLGTSLKPYGQGIFGGLFMQARLMIDSPQLSPVIPSFYGLLFASELFRAHSVSLITKDAPIIPKFPRGVLKDSPSVI